MFFAKKTTISKLYLIIFNNSLKEFSIKKLGRVLKLKIGNIFNN